MKYIIMCGGTYPKWIIPRQLLKINNETIVERTIRLLKENGVTDIAISSNDGRFENLGVEVLHHKNDFIGYTANGGYWVSAFYPTTEPVCYLMGDVYFSDNAIKTIVETPTNDIEFFASAPPFPKEYIKEWAEPFAFKVQNTKRFFECVNKVIELDKQRKWNRHPIAWELWQVIKGTQLNVINYNNYTKINDYTCDIDTSEDFEKLTGTFSPINVMIHSIPERMWYVNNYLIPSLHKQGIYRITVWEDEEHKGNLESCMQSLLSCTEEGGTWHLQDDVIISSDFRKKAEEYNNGVVCGFCNCYSKQKPSGVVTPNQMWYSFPCIRIPNDLGREFAEWFYTDVLYNSEYRMWVKRKKYDDSLFEIFMKDYHEDTRVFNLKPNIANHIDYLLGGSVINSIRNEDDVSSIYWKEPELIQQLEKRLSENKRGA